MPTPILTPSQHNFVTSRLIAAGHHDRMHMAASMGVQNATDKVVAIKLNDAEINAVNRMHKELKVDHYELAAHYAFNKYK